jgi:ribonuclease R
MERYLVAFLADRTGAEFNGHISGVVKSGLFIELDENGAQGFIPRGALRDDFYLFDEKKSQLIGRKNRRSYRLGQPVRVILEMADVVTGSLRFELIEKEGRAPAAKTSHQRKQNRKKRTKKRSKKKQQ